MRLLLLFTKRNLIRQKFYTLINLVGLTLGFISFLFILLYVSQENGFDEFHSKSERIYRLISTNPQRTAAIVPYTWGQAMKEEIPGVENKASFQNITIALTVKRGDDVFGQQGFIGADSTFLDIFDFPVVRGTGEQYLRDPNKMLITQEMADKYFPGQDAIGQTLQVNLWNNWVTYEVQGIVRCPKNSHIQFRFIIPIQLVRRHFFDPSAFDSWRTHFIYTYLLMSEDFDSEQVHVDFLDMLERHGGEELRQRNAPGIFPLEDIYLKSNVRYDFPPRGNQSNVNILLLVGIGVLLMAVINFINIGTAQSLRRTREASLRKVMGSSRKAIVLQALVESNLISVMSMLLAILGVIMLLPYFNDLTGYALVFEELIVWQYAVVAIMLSLIVGLAGGIYPAVVTSAIQPISVLRGRMAKTGKGRLRQVLVVTQFALAVILLIASGIIYRQVEFMRTKDLGFRQEQVVVMSNARNIANSPIKTDLLRKELVKHQGIEVVSAASTYPGDEHWASRYVPDGYGPDEGMSILTIYSDHDFSETYDLEFVFGRGLDRNLISDSSSLLINEAAMNLFATKDPGWATDPLGKEIKFGDDQGKVIGVLKDFHFTSLKEDISPLVVMIDPSSFFSIQVKLNTTDIPKNLEIIESTWKRLFPEAPYDYAFLDQEFAMLFVADQRLGRIIRVFTLLSVVVAVLGLSGLATFLAFQKAREMSIRKVVGASENQLIRLLGWHFIKLILIANFVAIPVSYLLMNRWLSEFAYRSSLSAMVFLMAGALSMIVAALTVFRQSYKTAVLNPVDVLNTD